MSQGSPEGAESAGASVSAVAHAPRSKTDLFWAFTFLAMQGFGGVLTVVQRELVEKKKWLTLEQFVEDWAVAQIMPGPTVVNLSLMIGGRCFGLAGALSALAGLLLARRCWCWSWLRQWPASQTPNWPKACCVAWARYRRV